VNVSPRWLLPASLLALLVPAGPLLLGTGVDLPDDALFHAVPLWEWMRTALLEGRSPWFVPGKLGGVSLFADASIQPLYPGNWLVALLPAHAALTASMVLHAVGCLLAVRWMARVFGASATSATVAGVGVAVGTIGSLSFVDLMIDTWPVFVWFPVALGALERLHRGPEGDRRAMLRWAAIVAGATALILLGSHLRYGLASGAALLLWATLGPGRLPDRRVLWGVGALAMGLLAGSAAVVPALLEWQHTATDTARVATLSMPAHDQVSIWNLPGLLAPKPLRLRPDWSIGLVLGLALLIGAGATKQRRLLVFAVGLYVTGIAGGIPVVRWLFAPLLLVTHPVDTFWGALALLPGAAVAALALDRLLESEPAEIGARLRGPAGAVVGTVVVLAAVRVFASDSILPSRVEQEGVAEAALQALVGVGILVAIARSRPGPRRTAMVCALALVDVALISVRFHTGLPSLPLRLNERARVAEVERLNEGYLHLGELADLEGFLYDTGDMGPSADLADEGEDFDDLSARTETHLLGWRWPAHLGVGRGLRSASGRAKMPPRRPLRLMAPLADALVTDPVRRGKLEEVRPAEVPPLFDGASSLGIVTMRLMRVRVAVGGIDGDLFFDAGAPAPRCWIAGSLALEADEGRRVERLLGRPFDPAGEALVEDAGLAATAFGPATVDCAEDTVTVAADGPTLVVVGETWHPGWRVGDGRPTFPVNQVHFGFVATAADTAPIRLRFVPPGLREAGAVAAGAWLLILGGLALGRRREST